MTRLVACRAKASLPHGSFLPWIEAEFGMHQTTANRFMHVATHDGSKVSTVLNPDPSALYELAAPKTPAEVREKVEWTPCVSAPTTLSEQMSRKARRISIL